VRFEAESSYWAKRYRMSLAELKHLNPSLYNNPSPKIGTYLVVRIALGLYDKPAPAGKLPIYDRPLLRWPARGPVSSPFGKRGKRMHEGIDIAAAPGSEVRAAGDGYVLYARYHRDYGNMVIIRHESGLLTVYAHHKKNVVHVGQIVRRGQLLAYVGSTGRSTGPHLHFEVRNGRVPYNPLWYLWVPKQRKRP
jgi:murein DD-endopeptidase MepM/ murein hydrolase activator NlpD